MKLLGSTENKIDKNKNGANLPHLEITEVVLVHFNIIKSCIHSKPLEEEDKINNTLVIN